MLVADHWQQDARHCSWDVLGTRVVWCWNHRNYSDYPDWTNRMDEHVDVHWRQSLHWISWKEKKESIEEECARVSRSTALSGIVLLPADRRCLRIVIGKSERISIGTLHRYHCVEEGLDQ